MRLSVVIRAPERINILRHSINARVNYEFCLCGDLTTYNIVRNEEAFSLMVVVCLTGWLP